MRINNDIYETYGRDWWAEDAAFNLSSLRYCVNPVRYGYFRRSLEQLHLPGKMMLDIGCGGGFLAEEFARDGFTVTGIDPSGRTIEAARKHATENRLAIDYRIGRGESLPFPDGSFDVAACCDVLEHVDDPGQVIVEAARTLKAGGVFFYDTLNRTWLSKLVLKVWQEWSFTRCSQANVHLWEKFITPAELLGLMRSRGLSNLGMKGISPRRKNPLALLGSLRAFRRRKMNGEELARAFELCETRDLSVAYMGFAIKEAVGR